MPTTATPLELPFCYLNRCSLLLPRQGLSALPAPLALLSVITVFVTFATRAVGLFYFTQPEPSTIPVSITYPSGYIIRAVFATCTPLLLTSCPAKRFPLLSQRGLHWWRRFTSTAIYVRGLPAFPRCPPVPSPPSAGAFTAASDLIV